MKKNLSIFSILFLFLFSTCEKKNDVIVIGHRGAMGHALENTIESIKKGEVIIVVDDAHRENEGDFIMAAEKATPETVGYMVRHSSGVLCVSMGTEHLNQSQATEGGHHYQVQFCRY